MGGVMGERGEDHWALWQAELDRGRFWRFAAWRDRHTTSLAVAGTYVALSVIAVLFALVHR